MHVLILKAPITTAEDDSLGYLFIVFSENIILDISCESSAGQRIHMIHQALSSSKDTSKRMKVSSAALLRLKRLLKEQNQSLGQ